jgi:DNA-binding response OmpR family regulator
MDDIIIIGPIRFDARRMEVESHGKTVRLTSGESRILRFLMEHANTVCTHHQISVHIWEMSDDVNTRFMIKAHIRHLRQKLEPDPESPTYLLTVPGVGYKLVMIPQAL